MSDQPKISVLIPTYEYARFLPEAIESVLGQDFRDFELLISDDASRDGSGEIIRRFARQDSRIRYQLHTRNIGMVANWNWCLSQARGTYIKFLFGDDRLMSLHSLGRMAEMLDDHPRAVLAATARVIIDDNSKPIEVWDELGAPGLHLGTEVIRRCLVQDRNLVGEPSAVLFRRAADARGFDPTWRQLVDQEMWFHLLLSGDLVYEREPLCAFRHHEAQQTVVNRKDRIGATESIILTARYFEFYLSQFNVKPGSYAMRHMIFRRIYYGRKEKNRPDVALRAEVILFAKLGTRWYFICWLVHRFTKPFLNLKRFSKNRWADLQRIVAPAPEPPPIQIRRPVSPVASHSPR